MSRTTKEYFNAYAKTYDSLSTGRSEFNERYAIWRSLIDDQAERFPNGLCMDLGCGNGFLSVHAASKGFNMVSVDGSSEMLSLTKKLAEKEGVISRINFVESLLPLSKEIQAQYEQRVQLILMSSVIEYVKDDEGVFEQCASLLQKGGIFLISFPNKASVYRKMEFSLRNTPIYADSYVRHQVRQYDEQDIRYYANKYGFNLQKVLYFALPFQRYAKKNLPRPLSSALGFYSIFMRT
ncbi:MAG: class I SAM-dependent methyltransferase [Chloroherpetonaceae bacterium]